MKIINIAVTIGFFVTFGMYGIIEDSGKLLGTGILSLFFGFILIGFIIVTTMIRVKKIEDVIDVIKVRGK